MVKEHTVKAYDQELALLKSKISEMAEEASQQIARAIEALLNRDKRLAITVIFSDSDVNMLQSEVDRLVVRILAMRQPVALDLRNVISASKIAAELERIADYAANIAKHISGLDMVSVEQPMESIVRMANLAREMLTDVIDAYWHSKAAKAEEVWQRDELINQIYAGLLAQLHSFMQVDSENIQTYTSLIFVARCCERIGDHIKNVAENVLYIQHGEIQEDFFSFQKKIVA